jgi:UDP-glucose 4-epimerase
LRLLGAAKKTKVKKFIFFSSAAIYDATDTPPNKENDRPNPITPYGIGKFAIELFVMNSGIPYTIIRPSNVYGPRQGGEGEGGVVAVFCSRLAKNLPPKIYNDGKQTRDYVFVGDVVRAAVLSSKKAKNQIVNISTNKETSVNKLCQLLLTHSQKTLYPVSAGAVDEQHRSALDNKKASKVLVWRPEVGLSEGLEATYNWFKTIL